MIRTLATILAAVALALAPGSAGATQTAPVKPRIVWDPIPFGA